MKILEEIMLDVMYDVPSSTNIEKCSESKDTVVNNTTPELVINENKKNTKKPMGKKSRIKRESVS